MNIQHLEIPQSVYLTENDLGRDGLVIIEGDEPSPPSLNEIEAPEECPLKTVDLSEIEGVVRQVNISAKLPEEQELELTKVLKKYKGCFAWEYSELPGLSKDLVVHKLPIKPGYLPVKQTVRRMTNDIIGPVKAEIQRLLEAGFIRPERYADWIANVVPVKKKNGTIRVCIDYRNLNQATPQDGYPMPVVDTLVDRASGHEFISFLDGHSGYNQIYIDEADIKKTAFRCPGALGLYVWIVMPFGLKNAGATYQRAMNTIFHDMIGNFLEVYIDDIVIKSKTFEQHMEHLSMAFERMRKYNLKMNPKKGGFGMTAGHFLGFLVHKKGIQVDSNKAKAILETNPPTTVKELQKFLGQVNFLRRFIQDSALKTRPLTKLLGRQAEKEGRLEWGPEQQGAFESIKEYLTSPPVLAPPMPDKPIRVYVSASESCISSMLTQEREDRSEQAIYYLSKTLNEAESRYSAIEKRCYALYYTATKLRHYLTAREVHLVSTVDLIRYMLSRPIIEGRVSKWSLALSEFSFRFIPRRAVKGQAVTDFMAEFTPAPPMIANYSSTQPWTLHFDGSSTHLKSGAGVVIKSPQQVETPCAFALEFICSNNEAEYEALIIGLEMLIDMGASVVTIYGDSLLVINQITGEYQVTSMNLTAYHSYALRLLDHFKDVVIWHIPRKQNAKANYLAQMAAGLEMGEFEHRWDITVLKKTLPSVHNRDLIAGICHVEDLSPEEDWRNALISYLRNPSPVERKLRERALLYLLMGDELYRRSPDGLLLRCLSKKEAQEALYMIHSGACGAHQAGHKMRWLLRRHGYYWPTILKDCIEYARRCIECQKHGPIQHIPATEMYTTVRPWPFRGWAMDIIGEIHPHASNRHAYILVATDYFTKWVEVK